MPSRLTRIRMIVKLGGKTLTAEAKYALGIQCWILTSYFAFNNEPRGEEKVTISS
jgi:hypothetical protein